MRSTEDPFAGPQRDEALRAWAATRGVDIGAARQRLTYERLLARMDAALPLRFIVRGGRAIDLRFDGRSRPTPDLDVDVTEPATTRDRQCSVKTLCHRRRRRATTRNR